MIRITRVTKLDSSSRGRKVPLGVRMLEGSTRKIRTVDTTGWLYWFTIVFLAVALNNVLLFVCVRYYIRESAREALIKSKNLYNEIREDRKTQKLE